MEENKELLSQMIKWRRFLHQHPEASYNEGETSKWLQHILQSFDHFSVQKVGKFSLVATIQGKRIGEAPVLGFRSEIDALPVLEQTKVGYRSRTSGVMHACGHDGHMAILLGLAYYLSQNTERFAGIIKLIFQSAEEIPPGGAIEIIDSGAVSDVEEMYAFHIFPNHPVGNIGLVDGPVTAFQDIFRIEIKGKGTHGAYPENGIDTILVTAQIIDSVNHIVARNISAFDNAVISFGQVHSGNVFNVIPDTAFLEGNIRTTSPEVRTNIKAKVKSVAEGIAEAYGAKSKISFEPGYDAVINSNLCYQTAYEAVEKVLGRDKIFSDARKMVSEDFSAYSKKINSCFMILGGGINEERYQYMNHHPKFNFDERCMIEAFKVYKTIILLKNI